MQDKVTRKELKELKPGEVRCFELPTVEACNSAHTTLWSVRKLTGWDLEAATDYAARIVTVRRNA